MRVRGDQNGPARRIGDPVFVPCADNYRYAATRRTTEKQILKAWRTPTPRRIGFTTHHLSLKDRNSLKPWLLTQGGKTQSVLSVEVCKHPIAVIREKVVWNSHGALVLLFCLLRTCSVHRVGYWEMMSERNHQDSFISLNRKHTRISSVPNLVVPKLTACKTHIKVIVSQTAALEVESKLYMTAVTRNSLPTSIFAVI